MTPRKAMNALFAGKMSMFKEGVERALLIKIGEAIDDRRGTFLNEEAPAPNRPKGEQDIIDLHHVEMNDDPVAGENQFGSDYIDKDHSRPADQEDGDVDWPENSDAKMRKVVMHGTGDRVYDEDEADLDEGIFHRAVRAIKRYNDKKGGWDSKQANRVRDKASSRADSEHAKGQAADTTTDSGWADFKKHSGVARKNRERALGTFGDKRGRMGRGYIGGAHQQPRNESHALQEVSAGKLKRYITKADREIDPDYDGSGYDRKQENRQSGTELAAQKLSLAGHKGHSWAGRGAKVAAGKDKVNRTSASSRHKFESIRLQEVSAGKLKRYISQSERQTDPDYDGSYYDRKQENRQDGASLAASKLFKAGHKEYKHQTYHNARVAAGKNKVNRTSASTRNRNRKAR